VFLVVKIKYRQPLFGIRPKRSTALFKEKAMATAVWTILIVFTTTTLVLEALGNRNWTRFIEKSLWFASGVICLFIVTLFFG
jgi:hypothetical protein